MTKWGSTNDVLKQLPPVLFGTWGGLHLYQNQKGSSLYHIQQKQMPSVNWEE